MPEAPAGPTDPEPVVDADAAAVVSVAAVDGLEAAEPAAAEPGALLRRLGCDPGDKGFRGF